MAKTKQEAPINNIEIFVKKVIQEINQEALAEAFYDHLKNPNAKKINLRVENDIYKFYQTVYPHYQTAMNKALRTVMEAVKAGQKMELN